MFHIDVEQHLSPDEIIERIRRYANEYQIPMSHITIDAIGVGEGIAFSNRLNGVYPYKSSNAPMIDNMEPATRVNKYNEVELYRRPQKAQYSNLRSQTA